MDSVNITAWGVKPKTQEGSDEPEGRGSTAILYAEAPPIQLIQEHKLVSPEDFRMAEGAARAAGFKLYAQKAVRTDREGVSGGVGILVDEGISAGPLPHKGVHTDRWAPYSIAGKMGDWVFIVVYGYPTSRMCPLNQALHKEVADWIAGQGNVRIVVGGGLASSARGREPGWGQGAPWARAGPWGTHVCHAGGKPPDGH